MRIDKAFKYIRNSFESGRNSHAYIVEGPLYGDGMELVLRVLELCFCDIEGKRGCGVCRVCRQIRRHTHPDVCWIEPHKKSRIISVEQIRRLQKLVYQTSFMGKYKACIIVSADRLRQEAANAFLKTLEEPPGQSLFFLLTDSCQFLIPTIISRCQLITVSGEQDELPDEWKQSLYDILEAEYSSYDVISAFALSDRINGLFKSVKETVEKDVADYLASNGLDYDKDVVDAMVQSKYKEIRKQIMLSLLLWYRDIFLMVNDMDVNIIHHYDHIDFIKKNAEKLSYSEAIHNVEIVEDIYRKMERNMLDAHVLNFNCCEIAL